MLGDHPIHVVLLSLDLGQTRAFYHDQVGLEVVSESEAAISFRCGPTTLDVTKSTTGTADEQTQAAWFVDDVAAEIAELRGRGVEIQAYDLPELKTVDGIADLGFALGAWIVDPHQNALAILQLKN
jgi:catechol 2,3-dioxygenase-like lactoylglutathione lyase family enzyme